MKTDRNFDDIADHFETKVYGSKKGQIRLAVLWRDIERYLNGQCANKQYTGNPPSKSTLKVLDVAGGLGQLSLRLAQLGHDVTLNDISINMLDKAKAQAHSEDIKNISLIHAPYQALPSMLAGQTYDLILCHALLEWLAQPSKAIHTLAPLLADDGALSLCFYNPVAKIYRNLIMGNFYNLDNLASQNFKSDAGSLTPNTPCSIDSVKAWLADDKLGIVHESGIRVFSDYAVGSVAGRGGHTNPEAVIEKELEYSTQAPYKYMGRYFHILAKKI